MFTNTKEMMNKRQRKHWAAFKMTWVVNYWNIVFMQNISKLASLIPISEVNRQKRRLCVFFMQHCKNPI